MQRITGAAVPLTFKDGVTLQFSPLTDKDTEEIDEWLRARIIQIARNSFTPLTSVEERGELLQAALRQAAVVTYTSQTGLEMLASVVGITFICWLSVRKEHPKITIDDLYKRFIDEDTGPENINRANEAFNHVNFSDGGPSKKAQRAKQKRA